MIKLHQQSYDSPYKYTATGKFSFGNFYMSGTLCKEGDSLHGQFTFCNSCNHRSLGFSGSPGVTLPYSLCVTPRKHLETPLAKCWSKQEIIGHLMSVSSFWAGSLIKARFTRLCLLPSLGLFITSQGQGEWRVRTQVEMIKAARQRHNIPSLSGESLFLRNKNWKPTYWVLIDFRGTSVTKHTEHISMPVKNCKPAATCSFFFENYKFLYKKQSNVIKKARKKEGKLRDLVRCTICTAVVLKRIELELCFLSEKP